MNVTGWKLISQCAVDFSRGGAHVRGRKGVQVMMMHPAWVYEREREMNYS